MHDREPALANGAPDVRFFALLHVGFIFIEETAAHIERLRNEAIDVTDSVARSKIGRDDSRIPVPIDKTSALVLKG